MLGSSRIGGCLSEIQPRRQRQTYIGVELYTQLVAIRHLTLEMGDFFVETTFLAAS